VNKVKDRKGLNLIGLVTAFGISMILTIGGLIIFGYIMDQWLETGVVFTIIGGVLGVFSGIYNFIRQVIKLEEKDEKQ
jgi:F0F1-type ATP synthase assembly protein I